MSDFGITNEDILATTDFISQVAVEAESVDIDEAVTFRHLLEQHIKAVRLAISLIDSDLIRRLESPQIRDGVEYRVGSKAEKTRYDHDRILSVLADNAGCDRETGEIFEKDEALERLAQAVKAMYLSPSVTAKAGGMKAYKVDRQAVETIEWGGKTVKVTSVQYTDGGET